ncbi:MAG: MraZ protein [Saprospiraceae bacterium]|jgi:MraZ protein
MTGEYDCKIDSKGRVRLPSGLVRQLGGSKASFTVNRGFEKHLIMYPKEVWERKTNEINQLNIYNTQHRQVIRYFYRGATELQLDSADRILLPKGLVEFAGIQKDLVLFAYLDQIEIWAKDKYEEMTDQEPEEFSIIANQVFGGNTEGNL